MKKNLLLFCIACAIIFYMTLFTWGSLPKDATHATTIDEEIASAVDAHNNDPTAHLDIGQSLQEHKSNDILDHPAGSVKNDKSSFNAFYYDLKFSDYSTWSKYKAGSAYSFSQYLNSAHFETYPSTGAGYNRLDKYFINNFLEPSSFFISANINTENTPHSSQYWSFGLFDSTLAVDRVNGFKYKNGKLYASLFKWSGAVSADHELVGVNIFDNTDHNLRLYYDATLKVYTWYIDGLQVYQYDNSANTFPPNILSASGGFDFNFTYNVDYDFVIYCFDYILSVDSTY